MIKKLLLFLVDILLFNCIVYYIEQVLLKSRMVDFQIYNENQNWKNLSLCSTQFSIGYLYYVIYFFYKTRVCVRKKIVFHIVLKFKRCTIFALIVIKNLKKKSIKYLVNS